MIQHGIYIDDNALNTFKQDIDRSENQQELLAAEGRWAKALYKELAKGFNIDFKRDEGKNSHDTLTDIANNYLDHGNYIAYGYAAVALNGMGISFALPILHGKTRRGGLVFDLADLVKDAFVMPTAFICASKGLNQKEFRMQLIEICQDQDLLDYMFSFITDICSKIK